MKHGQITKGRVYLVGAGPGDPDLLTLKAHNLLQRCDVVIFDYLVNPVLLQYVPPIAERIFIGKPRDGNRLSQREVEQLLVERAQAGKNVVRLKGGDPFIFGRGGEEAEALVNAGIEWEVVPGISAGNAVAAYAGIPLTHRDFASSVAFVTGHESAGKSFSVDWRRLATAVDTLVIFMGAKNLSRVVGELVAAGRELSTAVAVIEAGTRPEQRIVQATLATIVDVVTEAEIKSPALAVVGDVVNLRNKLSWFPPAEQSGSAWYAQFGENREVLTSLS